MKPFNPYAKKVVYAEGEPFAIPMDSIYKPRLLSGEEANGYTKLGITCKKGEVLWVHKVDGYDFSSNIDWYAKNGFVGCAYPLNDKELHYWLNRERIRFDILMRTAGYK